MLQNTDQLKKAFRVIEQLEAEVETLRAAQVEPIAIVGLSCRFPGSDDPDAFWSFLQSGGEAITEVPPERWDIDALYDADPDAPGKMSTRFGGFLKDIDRFDAAFFNISPREAALMDPQQRLLLELSWEALETGALSPDALYGSPTGVFVGVCASDYGRMATQNVENLNAYWGTGNVTSVAAGRLSYTFGFTGPCLSIDTACSSALVAVHNACDSLRKGECDAALAASVNLVLAPEATVAFSKARMMSPDGRCQTFDERANGYVRSEGAAVLVLKTLSKARADGDRIFAIVRGSAINQDGASGGLTVPNGPSQVGLIREAQGRAGIAPEEVDLIEAHGTGTALGDPIEVGALAEVFGASHTADRPLLLGSVKTVLGHMEVAAGMGSLIKVILALQNETIPGYRHLQHLSSRIPWARLPFAVPTEPQPWPRGGKPRIAGVSAFGFSGTNAHVILQEAPAATTSATAATAPDSTQPAHLLCLSAKSEAALVALAGRHADWLQAHPDATLDAICWTANAGRAALPHRLAVPAAGIGDLHEKLAVFAQGGTAPAGVLLGTAPAAERRLALLFSGQGAQYAGMARELHALHPRFRATIDRCADLLAPHMDRPLKALLWGADSHLLDDTAYTQPALFVIEYALADLWRSWGIAPLFVMGHSVGEFAAACIAGVFSLEDGLALIAARGRLMQALPRDGAMAVVLAGRDAVAPLVEPVGDRVSIAAFNTPDQTVISGERAAVLALCERLQAEAGIANRGLLDVSHAFHSPLMAPILADFRAVAEAVHYSRPEIGFVSNLTGRLENDRVATADYWVEHVLAPVDFLAGVAVLERNAVDVLLEVGPKATLINLARQCSAGDQFSVMGSLRQNASDWSQMLRCLGTLFVEGLAPDWRAAGRCDQPAPEKLMLPTYPFQRQRHWLNEGGGPLKSRAGAVSKAGPGHPLLGLPLPSAALPAGDFQFETVLAAGRPKYLHDHQVYDKVVVPAAAYVEVALAGIARQFPGRGAALVNFSVQAALVLPPDGEALVQSVFSDAGGNRYRFKLFSTALVPGEPPSDDAQWQAHGAGEIELLAAAGDDRPASIDLGALRRRFAQDGEPLGIDAFYQDYAALGLRYGGNFRTVEALHRVSGQEGAPGESLARIALAPALAPALSSGAQGHLEDYLAHPTLLDGCFQSLAALFANQDGGLAYLPVGIEKLRLWRALPPSFWAHATLRRQPQEGDPRFVADIRLVDDQGETLAVVTGLQAVPVERRALAFATATWKDKFYAVNWLPQAREDTAPEAAMPGESATVSGGWLVLCDEGEVGDRLVAPLAAQSHKVVRVTPGDLTHGDKAAWAALLDEHFGAGAPPLAGIVHAWALGGSAVEENAGDDPLSPPAMQALLCGSTLALVQALMAVPDQQLPRLWLLTQGAQAVAGSEAIAVGQAPLWGFGRSIAVEHPSLNCTCIDLEPGREDGDALARDILQPEAEGQIAYRGGRRFVARLNRAASLQARNQLAIPDGAYRLRASDYGALDRLTLVPLERAEPAGHEVEIEIRAAAINFKDVLYCLGMLKEFSERAGILQAIDQPLGFECAGRIVRVGAAVSGFAVGDEVFTMAPSAMASHVTVDAKLVHRKPRGLSFEQAASLPTVFMTAIHSLEKLARIKAGDRVLIHAGAGGVGQAALQIARKAGATVYATASPGKWDFLKRQGVAHVMNSRTLDFAEEIMSVTEGRGVDIVINSLAGDYIPKSADVLAQGGRFVEIGKIGIWDQARMAAYRPDIAYFSFDLGDIEAADDLRAELLQDTVRGLEDGTLAPLPVKAFPLRQAEAAFRFLAQAKNIGKVVLALPKPGQATGMVRPDRSYLITGGLGALGLRVAEGLVAGGARHIVLAGRTAPDERARKAIEGLTERGAEILIRALDVADPDQVAAMMAEIAGTPHPLGGIVHAAGVLDDGVIVKQSWERFAQVMAPKVAGAWALHQASIDCELDFFVLFSSIASVMGAPGQANYAAANAFLDGLAQSRRNQGLPVTCINWGPWAEGGMAERTGTAKPGRFESLGLGRLSAGDGIEVLDHLLENGVASVTCVDMNWPKYLKTVTSAAIAKFYSLVDKGAVLAGVEEAGALLNRLLEQPAEAREAALIDALRQQIASVVGLASPEQIGLQQPLLKLGIDSLMAVELKNRIESGLRCTLNPTLLFDYPTLEALGGHLARDVLNLSGTGTVTPASAPVPATAQPSASEGHDPAGQPDDGQPDDSTGDAQPLAAMRDGFIEVEGRKLGLCRWADDGKAPLAICVHGVLDQAAIWDEVAVGLVDKGYRVLALDLRGHGRSDHHPAGSHISVMDLLVDLSGMVARTTTGPFTLVGHSIGSVVSSLFAALHPEKVSHLIMVEPVAPFLREEQSALDLLNNDLRYIDAPPRHPAYPDLATAARMLTLNHSKLSKQRSMALAQRIAEPCEGGLRWIWDARLRNPLGIDLFFTRQHYLSIVSGLKVGSTRVYGTTSQFAGTPVLLDPNLDLPGSRRETIAGGHNLHTDNAPDLLRAILAGAGSNRGADTKP